VPHSSPPPDPGAADPYAAWCRRLRRGDQAAFSDLFDELHPALLRYAWRLVRDEEAAQDVVQDAFLRLWRRRETLDPSRSLRSLLYTTVHNRALNWIRDRNLHARPEDTLDARVSAETVDEAGRMDAERLRAFLDAWIARLPPRRREAFVLSRYQGLTHAEIADVMGLTPRTINTHIVLALRDLRERLDLFHRDDLPSAL
jgi:RNA polymerase sigma-70 factor (ECF subfamily)